MKDFLKNPLKFRSRSGILDPNSPEFRARMEAERVKRNKARKMEARRQNVSPLARGSILDTLPRIDGPSSKEEGGVVYDEEGEEVKTDRIKRRGRSTAWQQKMVIRDVRNGGRMTRAARLAKTEKSHLCKSEFFRTSVKKLFPLANQIVGKPLTDAMVQMRFSKKKAAQDVLKHLEFARNEAIVKRGMGLGPAKALAEARRAKRQARYDAYKAKKGQETSPDGQKAEEGQQTNQDVQRAEKAPEPMQQEERLVVEDKKGKKRIVTDRTAMYVDEAWVGRGEYGSAMDYRGRGRAYVMRLPQTSTFRSHVPPPSFFLFISAASLLKIVDNALTPASFSYVGISVVLKEEATRIRQADDREAKRLRKKVWVPLPDRPVTAQRQYPLW